MRLLDFIREKLNPAQPQIEMEEGDRDSSPKYVSFVKAFDEIESVNRGTSILVNGGASFGFSVAEKVSGIVPVIPGIRKSKVYNLLNYQPNLYQDVIKFRSNIYTDLVLEGNAFIYYDGAWLYHLPAANVTIVPDPKAYIKEYIYSSTTHFTPD